MVDLTPDFTLEELFGELTKADVSLDGYYPTKEWAARLGVSLQKMLGLMDTARRQGKLLVAKERRLAIDGAVRPVPVYAFKLAKECDDGGTADHA